MERREQSEKQPRVILWGHPRSRSTAFEFCVNSLGDVEAIHEPFVFASFVGEDREQNPAAQWGRDGYYNFPVIAGYGFDEVRRRLEAEYPGKAAVFVKDMSVAMAGRSIADTLPRGYLHTFLIRDPESTVVSFNRILSRQKKELPECRNFKSVPEIAAISLRYRDIHEMYLFVTEVLKQPGIVVDSDDLCRNSEAILRQYCRLTGLQFRPEKMLRWRAKADHFEEISKNGGLAMYHEVALQSTGGFTPPVKEPKAFQQLPEELQNFARDQRKYYDLLYEKRIKTD